ncbi:hypothetical protein TVAG_052470 [Trichomonas vaginalis G3]|uniref:receptor protein-tyrosine kinase n=1 Tax=Trichomonas vaginalis (strain ATCC PRA-98 / G3) TaxID=412133 RepID=A2FGH5_TRIV3|nr:glycine-rich protein family [Trichomonas vaginalis G3]EAX95989.1 hypothetical protein TVAG_052470 [Trichomonas vaginalis G3]KAI5537683.1 glycine-rich protein family [Trichomonas vaginalis G3]|eukprot:XP_001308919.1 hypothetical protein [Trichomonas vaginalis G3]
MLNTNNLYKDSGGAGSYVKGNIKIGSPLTLYLYLGAAGEDQSSIRGHGVDQSLGGWNFGGKGGMDLFDTDHPENGAGGGGAVDIRLKYIDINIIPTNNLKFRESIDSRIIVAGSGGGAVSDNITRFANISSKFYAWGLPGGTLDSMRSKYTIGASQTMGQLGIGVDGKSTNYSVGACSGGSGSGYRGGYYEIPDPITEYFIQGGGGGSSYISGHPVCITSPYNISFTNTVMYGGNESMPQPFGGMSIGHRGNGVCRITDLSPDFISCNLLKNFNFNFVLIHNKLRRQF